MKSTSIYVLLVTSIVILLISSACAPAQNEVALQIAQDKATMEAVATAMALDNSQAAAAPVVVTATPEPTAIPTRTPYDVLGVPYNEQYQDIWDAWFDTQDIEADTSTRDMVIVSERPDLDDTIWMGLSTYTALGDEQRQAILDFVQQGGRLVVTGEPEDTQIASDELGLKLGISLENLPAETQQEEGCIVCEGELAPVTYLESSGFEDRASVLDGVGAFGADFRDCYALVVSEEYRPMLVVAGQPDQVIIAERDMGQGKILAISLGMGYLILGWDDGGRDSGQFFQNLDDRVLDPFILRQS